MQNEQKQHRSQIGISRENLGIRILGPHTQSTDSTAGAKAGQQILNDGTISEVYGGLTPQSRICPPHRNKQSRKPS
jgi:hypothetical protein